MSRANREQENPVMPKPEKNPDATEARAAEIREDGLVVVPWRGHRFEVPTRYSDWSVDLLESIEDGKSAGIIRGALGPQQWAAFKSTNPKVSDLDDLANQVADALGFRSSGESPASPA